MENTIPDQTTSKPIWQEDVLICPHCGNEDEFFIDESDTVIYCICGLGIMTA